MDTDNVVRKNQTRAFLLVIRNFSVWYLFSIVFGTLCVTVKGRNQTLFTLSTFEKKSSKGRKFYCKASVMTKGKFD